MEDGDLTDSSPDDSPSSKASLPKIIGIGLHGVFEIIRESRQTFPTICRKSLSSLLNILQGLQPEELSHDPSLVMESMFSTLMELAGSPSETDPLHPVGSDIRALACACLLSFAVALGDTGKLLQATATTLMSPKGFEKIVMPGILVSLQRSVLSVMLGQKRHPNFLMCGVLKSSLLDTFPVKFGGRVPSFVYGMASDGSFLYLHTCQGLFKVGSGYGGTVKGRVYLHQSDFEARPGWLLHAQDHLYFKVKSHEPEEDGSQVEMDDDFKYELYRIDCETLTIMDVITVKDASFEASPHVLFSDGTHLGVVSLTGNDNFVIKFLNVGTNPMTCVQETPLKLARKCVSVYGASAFDESAKEHQLDFGSPSDEVMDIQSGKEFSLLCSSQGKVYYTGKKGVTILSSTVPVVNALA